MPSIQENTSNNNNNSNVVVYPKVNCPLATKSLVNGIDEKPVYRNELNGPIYEVFHLVSFPVRTPKQGLLRAEDGIRKLRILERTQGIWTMDCDLQVDRKYIILYDKRTGHEVELIPIDLVFEPTSIVSEDGSDLYNNLFLFTALEDPKRNEPAEMHIFQCIRNHSAELVDEVLKRKEGISSNYLRLAEINKRQHKINPTFISQMNATETYRRQQQQQQLAYPFDPNNNYQMRKNEQRNLANDLIPSEHNQIKQSTSVDNALTAEQDLQTLNGFFDDIEKFVAYLNRVTSVVEVKSKSKKSSKKSKKENENLNWPSQQQYQDVLKTFKTSINLLAKLKGRIHNPNAPELVHFLFTPLTIILNGKSDTQSGKDIAKSVLNPLFTKEAKELLQNCLTSKQVEIWQSLGDAWTMVKEKTKAQNQVPQHPQSYPHTTVFYNGQSQNMNDQHKRDLIDVNGAIIHSVSPITDSKQKKIQIASKNNHKPAANTNQGVSTIAASMQHRRDEEMKNWATDLLGKGLKVFQVIHDRQGNNEKELTVKTGEFVEVIDDRKNWWRVKNVFGQIGHIPHTILQPFDPLFANKHH